MTNKRYSVVSVTRPSTITVVPIRTPAQRLEGQSVRAQENGDDDDISMPTVRKIWDPNRSRFAKFLWLCVSLVVFGACFFQCGERIHYYAYGPTAVRSDYEEKNLVVLPVLVLCHADSKFRFPAIQPYLLKKMTGLTNFTESSSSVYDLMEGTGMTVAKLWNISRVHSLTPPLYELIPSVTLGESTFTEERKKENADKVKLDELYTTAGTCYVVKTTEAVAHRGTKTGYLFISKAIKEQSHEGVGYTFAYCAEEDVQLLQYMMPYEGRLVRYGHALDVSLTVEETYRIPAWNIPCTDRYTAAACVSTCILKKIYALMSRPCRLPFMPRSRKEAYPDCRTQEQFRSAFTATNTVLENFTIEECSCPRKCHEIKYSLRFVGKKMATSKNKAIPYISVWLEIPSKLTLVSREIVTYNLSALFADLGGSIGIFLGLCILQLFEICSVGVNRLNRNWLSFIERLRE